jgi:hypothetical protein
MKHVVCFFLGLVTLTSAFATELPICSVSKSGRGRHGYDKVEWSIANNGGGGGQCWVGICQGPGRVHCVPPHTGAANLDSVDITAIRELMERQDDAWSDGTLNGVEYLTVSAEGEEINRRYRVEWSTGVHKEVVVDFYKE